MPIATPQGTLDFKSVDKVTFVGASSNTVIDTTTGSLGVGVGVGGPTSNLHVVGNTRLEGDINMLHTSNTASIKLNSNVVAEFPRSKKLVKYPRVLLTSETSGGYIVTSSEEISGGGSAAWQNWKPFGGFFPSNNNAWLTGSDSYPSTAGAASTSGTTEGFTLPQNLGTDSGGSATANGSWLKLQLPHKITLQYIRMNGNDVVAPDDFDVLGSNDDTNWNVLGGFTTPNPSLFNRMDQFDISATTSYLYYAVIIKSHRGTNHPYSGIYNLEYYGTPEYDPEAHGTDVTVKSYPNVPNTDWLEVYYDAKGLATMPSTVTDLAGGDQDASVYGVTLDTTNEAFVFNGSSYLETNIPQITTGVWPFTMSFWFKVNAHIGTTWNYLAHLGIQGTGGDSTLVGLQNDQISITTWGDSKINSGVVATPGVWYHVTSTWPGGAFYDNAKLYINAVSYGDVDNTRVETSPLSFPTSGNKLTLGKQMNTTSDYFDGSIANFRLFNRALTSDEIYQLYAYQKEDFGHGDLSMTLKAGRLGIGTSEPRAALDVRGDIFGRGIIQVQSTTFNGITSGNSNSFTTLPGLTTKITPKRPGSKILVLLNLFWSAGTDAYFQGNVKKDGAVLVKQEGSVGSASKTSFATYNYDRAIYCLGNIGFSYLDDSNIGTQPIEYTVEVRNRYSGSQSWYINYTSNTADANRLTGVSTLTLLEIQQ